MTFLRPPDDEGVVYEFFSPFAHVEGRYEWCRIRSPTHGVFDTFILLARDPVVVYVSSEEGLRFMRDRYPECEVHRVPPEDLTLAERDGGRTVAGRLRASQGPVAEALMVLAAPSGVPPEQIPYGGEGRPVWNSRRWTCWGVDLVVRGLVQRGHVQWADGRLDPLHGEACVVTLGSFGRIAPLP